MTDYRRQQFIIAAAFIAGVTITIGVSRLNQFTRRSSSLLPRPRNPTLLSDKAIQDDALPDKIQRQTSEEDIREGIEGCIGNTPLFKIKSLSEATGCEILMKAEVPLETQNAFELQSQRFLVSEWRRWKPKR